MGSRRVSTSPGDLYAGTARRLVPAGQRRQQPSAASWSPSPSGRVCRPLRNFCGHVGILPRVGAVVEVATVVGSRVFWLGVKRPGLVQDRAHEPSDSHHDVWHPTTRDQLPVAMISGDGISTVQNLVGAAGDGRVLAVTSQPRKPVDKSPGKVLNRFRRRRLLGTRSAPRTVLRSDDEFAGETLGPTCCAQVGPHRQRARHFLVAGSIS